VQGITGNTTAIGKVEAEITNANHTWKNAFIVLTSFDGVLIGNDILRKKKIEINFKDMKLDLENDEQPFSVERMNDAYPIMLEERTIIPPRQRKIIKGRILGSTTKSLLIEAIKTRYKI